MKPRIRIGLMVGAVALILNLVVAFVLGLCSPVLAAVAGAVAGWFTAREENSGNKGEAAKAGALSGVLTGILMLVGQVVGGIVVLYLMQKFDLPVAFTGTRPSQLAGAESAGFYVGGLLSGLCFGALDIAAAATAGAVVGFLTTTQAEPDPLPPPPPPPPSDP